MQKRLLETTVLCVGLWIFRASAAVHYVDANNVNPVSPYTSWSTAATNIQDAVYVASFEDEVLVTNGTYQYGGFSESGSNRVCVIGRYVSVQSVNGPAVTVIEGYQMPGTILGSNAVRCVYLSLDSMLSGFTLTNGATETNPNDGAGGGVYIGTGCIVSNCVISGNAAMVGGGCYSGDYGALVNCKIIGNMATSSDGGAGAYGNALTNCLLAGNIATNGVGAAYNCTFINCTIVTNIGLGFGLQRCQLANCISYYNYPDNGDSGYEDNRFSNCCVAVPDAVIGGNNFSNAPAFVNLTMTNGDFHLSPDSPCINAGNNAWVAASNDLDGNPRIAGGTVDVGAYEYQAPVSTISYQWLETYDLPITTNTDTSDPNGTGFDVYQDWIAGLNPTNPASVLAMLPPPATANASGITVTWQSVGGIRYTIQRSTNLAAQPLSNLQAGISGNAGTTSYTDRTATNNTPYFYRVGVP